MYVIKFQVTSSAGKLYFCYIIKCVISNEALFNRHGLERPLVFVYFMRRREFNKGHFNLVFRV